jgi:hypothetical protein
MKAREPKPDISTALTVAQFCKMFRIRPELYAALKRCRLTPREVRAGARILLPLESIAIWRCEIEPLRQFAERNLQNAANDRASASAR